MTTISVIRLACRLIILFHVVTKSLTSSDTSFDAYVINGQDAPECALPWQALITIYGSFTCGAALIGPKHALTAAHCVQSADQKRQTIVFDFGKTNRTSNEGFSAKAKKISYAPDGEDIAVIELDKDVPVDGQCVSPIQLPPNDEHDFSGDLCYISGWGYTADRRIPNHLQFAKIDVLSYDECRETFGASIEPEYICAFSRGTLDKGICFGDSGGPLSCRRKGAWFIAGVASWTFGSCAVHKPSIFVRTSSYRDWIISEM